MSDTVLGGDFTVYYLDETRRKQIKWSGSTGTYTMNALYSALLDLFDESLQMDNGIPMSAQTPVEYTIGKIDAGDNEPWFVDLATMEHLKGGALRTSGWARATGTNTGVVVVAVTSNTFAAGDIGALIEHAVDGDDGTLLDIIEAGVTDYLVIRPDTSAAGDDWDSTSGTIQVEGGGGNSATQSAAAVTGEQIWANLYSIGTIEADTHIYLYQGAITDVGPSRVRVFKTGSSVEDWWSDGHIDICVAIKDYTITAAPIIDEGYITVLARQYSKLYDNFEVACSITAGGKNPIPLATSADLDNATGIRTLTFSGDNYVAGWAVGHEMSGDTSGARGILTKITTPGSTQTVEYYLVDDPLTDFQADENVTDEDHASATGDTDGSGPGDTGPALSTWYTSNNAPTAAYTHAAFDIDDDATDENYAITLDCKNNPLTEVYEWIKYATRRGSSVDMDGLDGEQYIGAEVYIHYTGAVTLGTFVEGDDVKQTTSEATGIIISYDSTAKYMLLRNVRGTFVTGSDPVVSQDNSGSVDSVDITTAFSPKKAAPLGTFAGGTFFGARGVLLDNWLGSDENAFLLTPCEGGTKERPTAITIEVTNLIGTDETTDDDDRVCVFRLLGSGLDINKTEYSAVGGEAIGDATLVVDTGIAQDVPGKTTGGVLRLRDADDDNKEYRIRYASWVTSTFTLANIAEFACTSATTTTITETGKFGSTKRGDLVYNSTRTAISYVKTVDSANQITIFPAITGQTDSDNIELNCVPIIVDTADDVYIPLIDVHPVGSTVEASIVYDAQIFFKVVVRNSINLEPIIPFATPDSTSGTDRSIATIRTDDTIITQ